MARTATRTVPARLARAAAQLAGVLIGLVGLIFNLGVTLGLGVVIGVVVGLASHVLSDHEERHGRPRRKVWRPIGIELAAAAPVLAGLIVIFGEATGPIVLLGLVAGSWYYARHGWSRGGRPAAPDVETPEPTDDLADLSNAELRRAWGASHARLRAARDRSQLEHVCELRQRQLDEMERRDPQGFRRWVGSGEWISGSAAPFLER